jgi:hypothetical protein
MRWRLFLAPLALVVLLAYGSPASATTITYELNLEFSGADVPSGVPTVALDDMNVPGSVLVTITGNLSGKEFIDDVYLNYAGDATTLNFAYQSGQAVNSILTGNQYKADGDGWYDILFNYPPPGNKFGPGETSTYLVTAPGLLATAFLLPSTPGGGNGVYFAAAHVQGIGADGEGSGWVGDIDGPTPGPGNIVPEPSSLALLGFGVLFAVRRLRVRPR